MVHGTHNADADERNKDIKIFINGELLARDDAKISVFDSGYLVGDGIWEALRLHQDKLVFLDLHLKRMWEAAAAVGMKLPFTKKELTDNIWTDRQTHETIIFGQTDGKVPMSGRKGGRKTRIEMSNGASHN